MNINITTYMNQLGYGIAGLNITKAFVRAGFDVSLWVSGPGSAPNEDRALIEQAINRQGMFDSSAPSLRIAHQWDMAHSVGRGLRMGMTFFELDKINDIEKNHLLSLDKIFIPSAWAGQVLVKNDIPIERVEYAPLGVDHAIFNPYIKPIFPVPGGDDVIRGFHERNTTVFFNCGKWEVRKGHDLLAEAFSKAFGPDDNVFLIMNCDSPFLTTEETAEWWDLYNRHMSHKIYIVPQRLPRQQDVAALMAVADCGVFPARAEGWNLELIEIMAMGKHVIATDYSAHTEYCNNDNCLLVQPDGMEPAFDGKFFKGGPDTGDWAELGPYAEEQLIAHLRTIHERKQSGTLGKNEQGIQTASRFTWDNTAKEILSVI
jgi:glycosyltransferase involved in cell wall biosynthesis